MPITKIAKRAKKTYRTGVKFAGNTVNAVVRPTTRALRKVTKRVPVVGRHLNGLAGLPRQVSRGGTSFFLALPNAVGAVAGTGLKVAKHTMFDPLLALGLSSSGKPKRITQKKKPKAGKARIKK
uniref:Uncharacterized protein n=1 Tax=viral metagenome TaxID=1070528 RepID=A0A6C0J0K5_9ZZZZ